MPSPTPAPLSTFSVAMVRRIPILFGCDGCKELRCTGRGTPEGGMLTGCMMHPAIAYLYKSQDTWNVCSTSDGDDSYANAKCLQDSSGFWDGLEQTNQLYYPDPNPNDVFAFEPLYSGTQEWLYAELEWTVDGKCNTNYAGHGGWHDAHPCSECKCTRADMVRGKCSPGGTEWSDLYKQAGLAAVESDQCDVDTPVTVQTAGHLANLLELTNGWRSHDVKVHHALFSAERVLPGEFKVWRSCSKSLGLGPSPSRTHPHTLQGLRQLLLPSTSDQAFKDGCKAAVTYIAGGSLRLSAFTRKPPTGVKKAIYTKVVNPDCNHRPYPYPYLYPYPYPHPLPLPLPPNPTPR